MDFPLALLDTVLLFLSLYALSLKLLSLKLSLVRRMLTIHEAVYPTQ